MKDFGIRVLTIEGAPETSEFETRAGRRFFDITDVVAGFVAERTGEAYFPPFAGRPAAGLYTTKDGGEACIVLFGLSCGSGVMAPFVQSSKSLGAHNAVVLASLGNGLRSLIQPEKPLEPFAGSVGRLVGAEAATVLMERAEELGVEYKSPSQLGGERSKAAADKVYAAALKILGWDERLGYRLEGYTDKLVGRTDPLGRFSRGARSRTFVLKRGFIPYQTIVRPIDYCDSALITKFGLVHLQIWVYRTRRASNIDNVKISA